MDYKFQELICLKLISSMQEVYPNSFKVYRILERFFDIYHPSNIFESLTYKGLIKSKTENYKKQLFITLLGLDYLNSNEIELEEYLIENHIGRKEFVDILFKRNQSTAPQSGTPSTDKI